MGSPQFRCQSSVRCQGLSRRGPLPSSTNVCKRKLWCKDQHSTRPAPTAHHQCAQRLGRLQCALHHVHQLPPLVPSQLSEQHLMAVDCQQFHTVGEAIFHINCLFLTD